MLLKCNACGGQYEDVQADGVRYFHQCAPLSDAEIIARLGLADDRAIWPKADEEAFRRFPRTRPNARDENVDLEKARVAGWAVAAGRPQPSAESVMKAPGAGAREVASVGAGSDPD